MNKELNPYIEVTRSFAMKKNLGNYESADFFCSAKRECLPEEAEEMSEKLLDFCRGEVIKGMKKTLKPKENGEEVKTANDLDL